MSESIYSLKIIEQNSCCILSNIVKDMVNCSLRIWKTDALEVSIIDMSMR